MKIEILKSAKGNEQKQNKSAKPPNPESRIPKTQAGPHAKTKQKQGKESHQRLYIPSQNLKQPLTCFFLTYINIHNE